jgi:cytoskeletal protein CcmA (bactofilin family)
VRIDGEFDGSISASETIVVGRTGSARAELEAREILVAGQVRGKLTAAERVELQEGAQVEGEIHSQSFMIADGVVFNGTCNMLEDSQQGLGRSDEEDEPPTTELGLMERA